ncbi:MAG: MarR family transcriptional regulator [Nocardioidaceae bacterium]
MSETDAERLDRQIDDAMEATRAMVAVVAQSLAETDVAVTLPQWRMLVILDRYGPLAMSAVAARMGVHPSGATRTGESLVRLGLVSRSDDPADRRRLLLDLTEDGSRFVASLLQTRRRAITRVVERVSPERRDRLAAAMRDFAEAVGDEAVTSDAGHWIAAPGRRNTSGQDRADR